MTSRLPYFEKANILGNAIADFVEGELKEEIKLILLLFPVGDNPQPTIITNYEPDTAEAVLEQVGEQIPLVRSSRRAVQ